MNFAKKQLEKYGWSEGKGLGKEENGIKSALKAKPKRGLSGLGHNIADEFTDQWWQKLYNKALDNIEVDKTENGEVNVSSKVERKKGKSSRDNGKISKSKFKKIKYLDGFVKTATLTNGIIEDVASASSERLENSPDSPIDDESNVLNLQCTDEQLYEACGKRTAHKGARHGLKSSGKLARIEMHEKLLLENSNRKIKIKL